MKLYHGTTKRAAQAALETGILPRIESGVKTNWPDYESHPRMTYLTKVYAPYFAYCAAGKDEHWAIIEVDANSLDETKFYPDEDFIAQVARCLPCSKDLKSRTNYVCENINLVKEYWRDSLNKMGTVAYFGRIPLGAIDRVVLFNPKTNKEITALAMDPRVSPINYQTCREKYEALTRWFFEAECDIKEFDLLFDVSTTSHIHDERPGGHIHCRQHALAAALTKRHGLTTIRYLPHNIEC